MNNEKVIIIITRIDAFECNNNERGNDEYLHRFKLKNHSFPEDKSNADLIFLHGCYFKHENGGNIDKSRTAENIKNEIDSWKLGNKDIYLLFHITAGIDNMRDAFASVFNIKNERINNYTKGGNDSEWKKKLIESIADNVRNGHAMNIDGFIGSLFPNPRLEALIHLRKTLTIIPLKLQKNWNEKKSEFENEVTKLQGDDNIELAKDMLNNISFKENTMKYYAQLDSIGKEIIELYKIS